MPDTKITGLTALAEAPAPNDLLVIVDVSDATMSPAGTDKKITASNLMGATNLDGLSDVVITAPAQGDILTRDAADWDNVNIGANQVIYRAGIGNVGGLAMAASTFLARLATGDIVAATVAQVKTLLNYVFSDLGGSASKAQLPAAVAYEDEANAFTQLNEFKDVELDDQDGTPVADRRLRTIDGLIRATTIGQVEGRYVSNDSLELMVGADGSNAGQAGAVPQPAATDNTKFLRGDGAWAAPAGGGALSQCSVYSSSGQVVNNNTNAAVQFANEAWDNDTMHDNVTNNTRITIQTAGRYQIFGSLQYDTIVSMSTVALQIRKNGSTILVTVHSDNPGGAASTTPDGGVNVLTEVDLVATDYVELLLGPLGANLTIGASAARFHVRGVAS